MISYVIQSVVFESLPYHLMIDSGNIFDIVSVCCGILVSIVSRDTIMHYLEVRRNLGSGVPKRDIRKQLSKGA